MDGEDDVVDDGVNMVMMMMMMMLIIYGRTTAIDSYLNQRQRGKIMEYSEGVSECE